MLPARRGAARGGAGSLADLLCGSFCGSSSLLSAGAGKFLGARRKPSGRLVSGECDVVRRPRCPRPAPKCPESCRKEAACVRQAGVTAANCVHKWLRSDLHGVRVLFVVEPRRFWNFSAAVNEPLQFGSHTSTICCLVRTFTGIVPQSRYVHRRGGVRQAHGLKSKLCQGSLVEG